MAFLIINADDYGLCDSVNRGIIECFEAGAVSDLSFMVNGHEFKKSDELLKNSHKTDIGFHLNLTAGQSLLGAQSKMTDHDGRYYDLKTLMIKIWNKRISSADIYWEIRSQIEFLTDHQYSVTHFDSHRNIHLIPAIMRALLQIRSDLGMNVPIRMPYEGIVNIFSLTPFNMLRIPLLNVLTMYCHLRTRYKWNIRTIGGNFYNNPRPFAVLNTIMARMGEKSHEVFELAVHPGYSSEKLMEYDEYSQQRLNELSVLKMRHFHDFSDSVNICSFADRQSPPTN